MRVLIDTGAKQVDLETNDNWDEKLLHLVFKALKALDYTEADVLRELKETKDKE